MSQYLNITHAITQPSITAALDITLTYAKDDAWVWSWSHMNNILSLGLDSCSSHGPATKQQQPAKKPVSSMEHLVGTHPRQEEICLQQSINRINIHRWIQHVWILQKNQLTTRVKAMNHSQDYKWVRAYLTLWQYWSNQTNIVAKHSSNLIPWQIISKPLHLTNQVHEPKTNIYKQPHKCKVIETYHTKISTTLHQTFSTHNIFLTQSHLPCYTLLQCQTCTSLELEARTNQWINDAGQVQAHILLIHTMRCTSTWI